MTKRVSIILLIFVAILPYALSNIDVRAEYPILQIDTEVPHYVGNSFTLKISAITDQNGQEDGITLMAFFDNIVPALSAPIVAPYLLNEEVTFITNKVSSGERLFSIKCTDYLGNTVWSNHTVFVDKTAPEILWFEMSTTRLKYNERLVFNWSVVDPEGYFEKIIINFGDGSEPVVSTSPKSQAFKSFNLDPYEYSRVVTITFTAQDLASNKAYQETQCEVYVPQDEQPEYPQSYIDELNEFWGFLRNRDAWITAGVFSGIFSITIPLTIVSVARFKKRRNIPAEEL